MNATYSLPLGIYNTQKEPFSLKDHNISVFVESLSDAGEELNHPRLNSYVGKTFQLDSQKFATLKMVEGDVLIDKKMFSLKYSNIEHKSLDINEFVNALKAADISNEYMQVMNTLMFGYLDLNVNHTDPYSKALKAYVEVAPTNFLSLNKIIKNRESYYFPGGSTSDTKETFKQFMLTRLEGYPQHQKVIETYCEDWAKVFEKKPKPKF